MTVDPTLGPPYAQPRKSRTWIWIAAGCGCLVLAAIVMTAIFGGIFWGVTKATAEPERVVREFLAAAAAGDAARAHDYFSDPLKQEQPLDQFTAIVQGNQHLFQVKDTTYTNRSVDMAKATLSGTLTLQNDTKLPCEFVLVKEKGAWKLISYSIGS